MLYAHNIAEKRSDLGPAELRQLALTRHPAYGVKSPSLYSPFLPPLEWLSLWGTHARRSQIAAAFEFFEQERRQGASSESVSNDLVFRTAEARREQLNPLISGPLSLSLSLSR